MFEAKYDDAGGILIGIYPTLADAIEACKDHLTKSRGKIVCDEIEPDGSGYDMAADVHGHLRLYAVNRKG